MGRMPFTGASIATPSGSLEEFDRALRNLGVGEAFDATHISEVYWRLGSIIGGWSSEREAMKVSTVAKELASAETKLSDLAVVLSATETGPHDIRDTTIASEIAKILAIDPAVGSLEQAHELISAFAGQAARLARVCLVAQADLPKESGKLGRPTLDVHWYDDFTALLLEIAEKAGAKPSNWKEREDQTRSGWLPKAAMALERFLPRDMRSPNLEACGKRLDRSAARLGGASGKKLSAS